MARVASPCFKCEKRHAECKKTCESFIEWDKADKAEIDLKDKLTISALNNDISPLINEIYRVVGLDEQSFKQPALNNTRQIGLLKHAKEALLKAKEDADDNLTVDLLSVSLMDAYTAILEILGEANQIDLSKEIFSRFCVGK